MPTSVGGVLMSRRESAVRGNVGYQVQVLKAFAPVIGGDARLERPEEKNKVAELCVREVLVAVTDGLVGVQYFQHPCFEGRIERSPKVRSGDFGALSSDCFHRGFILSADLFNSFAAVCFPAIFHQYICASRSFPVL